MRGQQRQGDQSAPPSLTPLPNSPETQTSHWDGKLSMLWDVMDTVSRKLQRVEGGTEDPLHPGLGFLQAQPLLTT